MTVEQIIKENKCTIVDVRTAEEFRGGNAEGSINIPLQEIDLRLDELKYLKPPLVLCCASGNRSERATQLLTQAGIASVNGGSWLDVNYCQTKTV